MSFLTLNRIVDIQDNKIIIENYQINPDANFRTEFSEYPYEKATAVTLLLDVLQEHEIKCDLRSRFDSFALGMMADSEEVEYQISEVKITKLNSRKISADEWMTLPKYSLADFETGKVTDLPMIQFEIYFNNRELLQGIPKSLVAKSTADTGMAMY